MPDWVPFSEAQLMFWLIVIAFILYIRFVAKRRRSLDQPSVDTVETLSGTELERYARHIMLHEVGGLGQKRLKQAKVLVIGAGGLGAPILAYLAAGGVGRIGVIDDDEVSHSNLQRQILFDDADIDAPKVLVAARRLEKQNPHIDIRPYHRRLTVEIANDLVKEYDLIIDGTDNFKTRKMVNAVAIAERKPLIAGAITQWEGQVSLYYPSKGGPCYDCLFPNEPDQSQAPTCAEAGVIGALPGVVGSIMAGEAIKYITKAGESLQGRMLLINLLSHEYRVIKTAQRKNCVTCGGGS